MVSLSGEFWLRSEQTVKAFVPDATDFMIGLNNGELIFGDDVEGKCHR